MPTPVPPSTPTPNPPTPVRWHWNSALAGALVAAILFGGFTLLWRNPTPPPIVLHAPPTVAAPTPEPTATPAPLVVFISGAVQTPGVYQLPSGARVADVLTMAGGYTAEANVDAVNQATPLRDGDQVHVPTLVEVSTEPAAGLSNPLPPEQPVTGQSVASGVGGLININTATAAELEQLPGIGPALAQAIIDNRPYASVDELDRVPRIGPVTLEELRPLIVVN